MLDWEVGGIGLLQQRKPDIGSGLRVYRDREGHTIYISEALGPYSCSVAEQGEAYRQPPRSTHENNGGSVYI